MGVESITDFATEAFDVASETLSDGLEYLSDGFDQLQEQVGSFAGDATWFDTNNFGDIVNSLPSVSDFSLPSLPTSIPSLSSITGSIPSVSSLTAGLPSLPTSVPSLSSITRTITSVGTGVGAGIGATVGTATGLINNAVRTVSSLTNPQVSTGTSSFPSLSSLVDRALSTVVGTAQAAVAVPVSQIKTAVGTVTVTGANILTPPFNGTLETTPNTISPTTNPQVLEQITNTVSATSIDRSAGDVGYTSKYNPISGLYDVVNVDTDEVVAAGLTEQQSILQAEEQTFIDAGETPGFNADGSLDTITTNPSSVTPSASVFAAYDDEGNLLPGYSLDEDNNPVFVGSGFVEPATQALADAARASALTDQARQQQTINSQRQNKAQTGDWRVRLRLAPRSNYLYNAADCGPVLWPLRITDGIIFPYTPQIDTVYRANYQPYDLTHSNYRGYFYKNSAVDAINLRATFTAQDTKEANYLLAVIHFFRSVTKMFYGQDAQRGSPPPMTYLSGFGDYQFNEHPCVVSQFTYSLPPDVNYIRAQSVLSTGQDLLQARNRQTIAGNPLSYALNRLASVGLTKGGLDKPFAPEGSLGAANASYVPTKMDINISLLPMQSRQQVSKQFSLAGFANGNLLKGGFW